MSLPTSPTLQQLYCLNASSSEFQDQLCNVFYGDEYRRCVQDLQGGDLVWLVDYLDKVRRYATLLHSQPKPLKALGGLDSSSPAFRKCLRELKTICGTGGMLPTSYTLLSHLLNIGSEPFASGGYGDVYEGTHNGSRVCIKRVRSYTSEDPKKAARVCHRRRGSSRSSCLINPIDLLPRGRNVEIFNTSKHLTPAGCHYYPLPAHFDLDAWRGPARVHQDEPRRRST